MERFGIFSTIYKYELFFQWEQVIELPRDAKIVRVAYQEDTPHDIQHGHLHWYLRLWAAVNFDRPLEKRRIWMVGTGRNMPPIGNIEFLGSIETPLLEVYHFFGEIL